MMRTLVEIGGGLLLLVVLGHFQFELTDLRDRQAEVARLEGLVERNATQVEARRDLETLRHELTEVVDNRLAGIEARIEEARKGVREASFLEQELRRAQQEAASLKDEIARDVSRTQELVRSYADELKRTDEVVREHTAQNGQRLEELSGQLRPDPEVLTRELLLPTVQLEGRDTVGSGTLVKSERNKDTGEVENWVLTAYHVVRNIFSDTPNAKRDGIDISVYDASGRRTRVRGQLVAHKRSIDVALVRLDSDRIFPNVAKLLTREEASHVMVWDEVYAVGCPLGNDPIPTRGSVTSTRNVLDGANYWMINAPTYYGNSGGGVFSAERRALAGVFSKIYTHGRGTPVVVPHMGLCTPMSTIYDWLRSEGLGNVLEEGVPGSELPTGDLAVGTETDPAEGEPDELPELASPGK